MIATRPGLDPLAGEGGSAVTLNALRVRPVERQSGEELGGHAAAAATVVVTAAAAGTCRLGLAQLTEQRLVLPDAVEAAVRQDVSGQETIMDRERAGVHIADRIDEAHHSARAAEVQSRKGAGVSEPGQMEE